MLSKNMKYQFLAQGGQKKCICMMKWEDYIATTHLKQQSAHFHELSYWHFHATDGMKSQHSAKKMRTSPCPHRILSFSQRCKRLELEEK